MNWKKTGWGETLGALAAAFAVGAALYWLWRIARSLFITFIVTGCAGLTFEEHYLQYSHRSSTRDFNDRNTSDTAGWCGKVKLGEGEYAPRMRGCLGWEVHDEPTYGRDPHGELGVELKLPGGKR